MKLEELKKYKKILILGYGKEGQATEKYLMSTLPGIEIGIADVTLDPKYLEMQSQYELAIKSPGISKKLVTIPYTTATNIFFANIKNTIVGVTGTKGKSTTASLIYDILKKAGKSVHLVGNIGVPMLSKISSKPDENEIFVAELSSYQLDDIKYSPHISVVLDLFPEHMNYHGSVQAYYNAKRNIIAHSNENDYFVYNNRFKELCDWADSAKCKAVPFEDSMKIDLKNLPLIGVHNFENIKAAVTTCHILGVSDDTIEAAVREFKPLPHRLEKVGNYKGIIFYDDAISTTPESTIAAISSLKNIGTIMLGGEDRGYDFENLIRVLSDYKIGSVVLFPESGKKIGELIRKKGMTIPHLLTTDSMEEAVKHAYKYTSPGAICLLSCASPSYSLWRNFEEKGDLFQTYVKKYSNS